MFNLMRYTVFKKYLNLIKIDIFINNKIIFCFALSKLFLRLILYELITQIIYFV